MKKLISNTIVSITVLVIFDVYISDNVKTDLSNQGLGNI